MPFVPESLGRLDTYGGTFGIDWSMPFVPESLGRLDPYGGTFGIDWSMPFVPWQSLGTFGID